MTFRDAVRALREHGAFETSDFPLVQKVRNHLANQDVECIVIEQSGHFRVTIWPGAYDAVGRRTSRRAGDERPRQVCAGDTP